MDNMPQPKRSALTNYETWNKGYVAGTVTARNRLWHVAVASGTIGAALGGLLSWYLM